ncbi:hypothetical protein OG554_03630 [Streptomyces griseus]|uniref:hypothetical protein n=1 Tax=Streptomyces griseus TaxID=1911 RepID=UPI00386A1122|nr:hypothetical protein OG554_03630 [Streptomyces fimicarius]
MTLSELFTAFSNERTRYRDPEVRATIDRLERAAETAVYEQNSRGGEARNVVAGVAQTLGVALGDTGVGHSVWDSPNMRRVVAAARALKEERDGYKAAYESKPAIMRLEGPGTEWLADLPHLVDDLKNTIVSQAREIARLKGESE